LNVLVPEMDKAEVSVFVMLLLDSKLEVASLASSTGEVALFAVKLKILKKCQFKTLLTVFTVTEKSCFMDTHLIWAALSLQMVVYQTS